MIDLQKLAQNLSSNDVILTYQGIIDGSTISDLLEFAEKRLIDQGAGKGVRKKVFLVMLESLQNSLKHGTGKGLKNESTTLALLKIEDTYNVVIGSFVCDESAKAVSEKLDFVNSLNHDELQVKYREILANGVQSEDGGSGLGLLDIARKSGNKIEYNIDKIDENSSYFTLKIKIL